MATNIKHWRDLWESETNPSVDELEPVDTSVDAMRVEADQLVSRCVPKVAQGSSMAINVFAPTFSQKSFAGNAAPAYGSSRSKSSMS